MARACRSTCRSKSMKFIHDPEMQQPPFQLLWHKRGRKRSFLRRHRGDQHVVLGEWSSTSGHSLTHNVWAQTLNQIKEMTEAHVFHTGTHTGSFLSNVRLNTQPKAGGCGRQSHNAMLSRPIPITGQVVSVHFLHSALSTCSQGVFFQLQEQISEF